MKPKAPAKPTPGSATPLKQKRRSISRPARVFALAAFLLSIPPACAQLSGGILPTLSWAFNLSLSSPLLQSPSGFPWFGWLASSLLFLCGLAFLFSPLRNFHFSPLTRLRWNRFRSIRRGYFAFIILAALILAAGLDSLLVGNKALAVHYNGNWSFPAFSRSPIPGRAFGLTGDLAESETNYRLLKSSFANSPNSVILPPIPFASANDSLPPPLATLHFDSSSGKLLSPSGLPFSGYAFYLKDSNPETPSLRLRFRQGLLSGLAEAWDARQNLVFSGNFSPTAPAQFLSRIAHTPDLPPESTLILKALANPSPEISNIPPPSAILFHPVPPLTDNHLLGTNSQGQDILAYLYGGLQINLQAAISYLPAVTLIGSTFGLLMGWLAGWFDLASQRVIEILSQVPILSILIIISDSLPLPYKGLTILLVILLIFDWIGIAYLMRTSAFREKNRDYIAAARVLGASTPRIIFLHLLPNSLSILVTILPFTLAGLILSLASLDYLGFGLPPEYPSWGRLLNDGLSSLSSPWIVTSAFIALVTILLLVTFIGEAIREAFDPKKFTYYR